MEKKRAFLIFILCFLIIINIVCAEEFNIELDKETVAHGDNLQITITPKTYFYRSIYVYDSSNIYKTSISMPCAIIWCNQKTSKTFAIPSNWEGTYYLSVYDYNVRRWIRKDFSVTACTDECSSSGARECIGDKSYAKCGNHDTDPCLEWGPSTDCSFGMVCGEGSCMFQSCFELKEALTSAWHAKCGESNYDAGIDIASKGPVEGADCYIDVWDLMVFGDHSNDEVWCSEKLDHTEESKLKEGLVSYYDFDGDAQDSIGENRGTVKGATLTEGKYGQAYKFDGVNDYIDLGAGDKFRFEEGTISAWVKFNKKTQLQAIFSVKEGTDSKDWSALRLNSGKLEYYCRTPKGTYLLSGSTTNSFNADEWHHVAYATGSLGNKFYIDGVEQDVVYFNGNTGTNAFFGNVAPGQRSVIGAIYPYNSKTANNFNGLIDEVKIWNRTLSAEEIREEYRGVTAASQENKKDMSKYSDKEVFLISDRNWRDVLPLVPLTTWTQQEGDNSSCKRGYGTPDDVCVYPTLIYHEEDFNLQENLRSNVLLRDVSGNILEEKNVLIMNFILKGDFKWGGVGDSIECSSAIANVGTDPFTLGYIDFVDWPFKPYLMPKDYIEGKGILINQVIEPGIYKFPITFTLNSVYPEMVSSVDIDSIINFMQQYFPSKIIIIGQTPQELDNLLVTQPELGAGLQENQIQRIYPENYFSYWQEFKDIVYVEDNYELALLASTYASLVNAPLIIQGTSLDQDNTFSNRNVICVGNVNKNCNEKYNLGQLQQKYIQKTNTDKVILVNPNDLKIMANEYFQSEKSESIINEIYGKTSLTAPTLAGSKHEIIISTSSTDYQDVDSFIEYKINDLGITPEYLTIIASPAAISFYDWSGTSSDEWPKEADFRIYADLDDNGLQQSELAVGRIMGITISDASSLLARTIFYNEIKLRNTGFLMIPRGDPPSQSIPDVFCGWGIDFCKCFFDSSCDELSSEYKNYFDTYNYCDATFCKSDDSNCIIQCDDKKDELINQLYNSNFAVFADHGVPNGWIFNPYPENIFSSKDIENLPPLFIYTLACSTCDYREAKGDLFCTNMIRNGAVGYIGAVRAMAGNHFLDEFFENAIINKKTVGESFKIGKNKERIGGWETPFNDIFEMFPEQKELLLRRFGVYDILIGDPTFEVAI